MGSPGFSRSTASASANAASATPGRLALGIAALPFALHLAALTHYDFFRDELYFIVCGRHPAFGYADQPPLVPLLAAASQSAGESLWLLRIIPALFHVGAVLAACAIVRRLGGGRGAQMLAGLATGVAPLLLGVTATLSTTAIEPLSWTLVAYAALRAVRDAEPRWWLAAGVVAGISLEAKYSIAFLLIAIVAGLLIAGPRATFGQPLFWAGAALAAALAAPSLIWQTMHGWPMLELLRVDAAGKNVALRPVAWFADQVLIVSPVFAPLWIAGMVQLVVGSRERFAGIAVLLIFATFLGLHAKDYYLAGVYPLLFAAGAVACERAIRTRALLGAYAVLATATTLVLAPLALPLLPVPAFTSYAAALHRRLGIGVPESEHHRAARLPQLFADMHGWRELADRVGAVERALPPDERTGAAVLTQNYGEAAAIDVFGDGSLPVISGHNEYGLWGPQGAHPVLIIVGGDLRQHERAFRDVRLAQVVHAPDAMPYEDDLPIFVAREPRVDLQTIWPRIRFLE